MAVGRLKQNPFTLVWESNWVVSLDSLERTSVLQPHAYPSRSVSSGDNCGYGHRMRELMDYGAREKLTLLSLKAPYFYLPTCGESGFYQPILDRLPTSYALSSLGTHAS